MKKIKHFICLLAALIVFAASSVTVSAAGNETPADIVARLTERDVKDVIQEKLDTGKTYGTIAKEYDKLDEFKEECLKLKEQILKENVKNGLLSQEEADNILAAIKEYQATCDGTGGGGCCGWNKNQGYGNGCGLGRGCGYGRNRNSGYGNGCGYGRGWNRNSGYTGRLQGMCRWR